MSIILGSAPASFAVAAPDARPSAPASAIPAASRNICTDLKILQGNAAVIEIIEENSDDMDGPLLPGYHEELPMVENVNFDVWELDYAKGFRLTNEREYPYASTTERSDLPMMEEIMEENKSGEPALIINVNAPITPKLTKESDPKEACLVVVHSIFYGKGGRWRTSAVRTPYFPRKLPFRIPLQHPSHSYNPEWMAINGSEYRMTEDLMIDNISNKNGTLLASVRFVSGKAKPVDCDLSKSAICVGSEPKVKVVPKKDLLIFDDRESRFIDKDTADKAEHTIQYLREEAFPSNSDTVRFETRTIVITRGLVHLIIDPSPKKEPDWRP